MKKQTLEPLTTFQATPLEILSLSGLLLVYLGSVYRRPQISVSSDEREMAQQLQRFYDRLVAQLPGGRQR